MSSDIFDDKPMVWWKNKKFLTGTILVVFSFALGFYGKIIAITGITHPSDIFIGIGVWIFSWLLLFLGAFIIGRETVKLIQNRIEQEVKTTVKKTYDYTKDMQKKSMDYTKKLRKKLRKNDFDGADIGIQ